MLNGRLTRCTAARVEEIAHHFRRTNPIWGSPAFASTSELVRDDGLSSHKARLGFLTILRADLDHGLVRRPGDREDIEQDAVFLVLGISLEAGGVERQDLSALQQRAPARDKGGLRNVELLERVRIRSAADIIAPTGRARAAGGSDVAMTAS